MLKTFFASQGKKLSRNYTHSMRMLAFAKLQCVLCSWCSCFNLLNLNFFQHFTWPGRKLQPPRLRLQSVGSCKNEAKCSLKKIHNNFMRGTRRGRIHLTTTFAIKSDGKPLHLTLFNKSGNKLTSLFLSFNNFCL